MKSQITPAGRERDEYRQAGGQLEPTRAQKHYEDDGTIVIEVYGETRPGGPVLLLVVIRV